MKHQISQHQFNDFEIFSEVLDSYDVGIKQLSRGSFTSFIQQISSSTLYLSHFTTSLRIEALGNPPPGIRTFGVPTANCDPFIWRDMKTDADTIQIYTPEAELSVITGRRFEARDVSVSEKDLNALTQLWGLPEIADIIDGREMVYCAPVKMHRLRNAMQLVSTMVNTHPDFLEHNPGLWEIMDYDIPFLLVDALMTSTAPKLRTTAGNRTRALKSAVEFIQTSPAGAITVEEVCLNIGVTKRTLQRAFRERYGVTPKFYLQLQRLNNVQKALIRGDPGTTKISNLAIDQGYWHMSQFASDYQRLFGELPSATLQRQSE